MEERSTLSDFAKGFDFEDIRAFYDQEVKEVMNRLISDPLFMKLVKYLWPETSFEEIKQKAAKVEKSIDFQLQFMHGAIRKIIEISSSGLTSSGFENLDPDRPYLFISNHRDILLDAAILQILLVEHGFPTSEITFGSNLKEKGFITDFGRLNRMFTVLREGTSKELYEISKKLSAYIRHTIVDKQVSVWIAQGNGRTKNGDDVTQSGLLKMLNLSGRGTLPGNFAELHIVPLTVSYEYEPCDHLKVQELYLSNLHTKYTKAQGEDLESIVTGIRQFKGKIHLSAGVPLEEKELEEIGKTHKEVDKINALVEIMNRRFHHDYQLHAVNHIAYDLLYNTNLFESFYSPVEKKNFVRYVEEKITLLEGEAAALKTLFLKIYAQPTVNKIHLQNYRSVL